MWRDRAARVASNGDRRREADPVQAVVRGRRRVLDAHGLGDERRRRRQVGVAVRVSSVERAGGPHRVLVSRYPTTAPAYPVGSPECTTAGLNADGDIRAGSGRCPGRWPGRRFRQDQRHRTIDHSDPGVGRVHTRRPRRLRCNGVPEFQIAWRIRGCHARQNPFEPRAITGPKVPVPCRSALDQPRQRCPPPITSPPAGAQRRPLAAPSNPSAGRPGPF